MDINYFLIVPIYWKLTVFKNTINFIRQHNVVVFAFFNVNFINNTNALQF